MSEILLVEDSETDAALLKRTLKGAKVTNPVRCVSDGSEAMASLREMEPKAAQQPEVVPAILMLDLKLPGVSGFEILSFLQGRAAFSKTLKIIVSELENLESI